MWSLHFQQTIGAGAFGTVYLAELNSDRGMRRQVAVKIILRDHADSEAFVSRMRDEARLLGLLHDDHVLKVLDLIQVEGRDAIIMEYVQGADMSRILEGDHRPPPRALAEIGATVAGALDRAHRAVHPADGTPLGVVHRDVKPANIMLTATGGLKLLDFGIARARFAARESTTGQLVLGTLNYMAPDYVVTGEVTPSLDVYGLGLSLWELITGTPYGQPKIREDVHTRRLLSRIETIRTSHGFIADLIAEMLDWDPGRRPSCRDVETRLNIIADEVPGPGLRSWSARVIPDLLAQRPEAPDNERLLGRTIQIRGPAHVPREAALAAPDSVAAPVGGPQEQETDIMDPIDLVDKVVPPLRASTSGAQGPPVGAVATSQGLRASVTHVVEPVSAPVITGGSTGFAPPASLSRAILRGILIGSSFGILAVTIYSVVLFR